MVPRRPISLLATALALTGCLAAVPLPAFADISRIGTYLEVGSGAIGQMHPDVAYSDKDSAYLVVWGDGAGGSDRPAYAQLVSGSGSLIGAKLELTDCGGELYGQRPRVVYTSGSTDDVFVVVYREWCSGSVNIWVHLVRYSSGGAVSVSRTSIRSTGTANGIVYNPQRKDLVVVWEELASATGYDAVGRAIKLTRNDSGVVTGVETPLAPVIPIGQLPYAQGLPRIALDPGSQSYLIAFQGEDPSTGGNALMLRTLDAATDALSPLSFAAQGGYNVECDVVYLPEVDQFLVTWRQGFDIVGRRFTPVSGAAASSTYPLIARPGTDGASGAGYDVSVNRGMVAGMNSDYKVWASEFSSSGAWVATFQGALAPATEPGGGTFFPQITATDAGVLALTYGIDYTRVYLERFAADGSGGGGGGGEEPSATLSVTSLVADKAFPITEGTSVTFTATATGGSTPYTYKFVTYNSSTGWQVTQDYSALNQLTYFPAAGTNAVQVWVRNAGSSSAYDAYLSSGFFTVNGSAPVITSFTADKTFPQPVNTLVTFTATVAGGISPQYEFWKYNVSTGWTLGQAYSGTNTFSYYPDTGTNAVQVWVRNTGSANAYDTYASSGLFEITGTESVVVTSLTADKTFPQPVNTSVTFTATASGGTNPLQYKFWAYNSNTGWTVGQDWTGMSTFTYFPAEGTNAVQVWVRSNGSSASYEAYKSSGLFMITSLNAPTSVTLTSHQSFPVAFNTLVSFTAAAVGGTDVQYQFWTYHTSTGWTIAQAYGALTTFGYYPQAGTNAVQVWVRNSGSSAAWEAWASSGYFTVNP